MSETINGYEVGGIIWSDTTVSGGGTLVTDGEFAPSYNAALNGTEIFVNVHDSTIDITISAKTSDAFVRR
jgi:hypothetical protein